MNVTRKSILIDWNVDFYIEGVELNVDAIFPVIRQGFQVIVA